MRTFGPRQWLIAADWMLGQVYGGTLVPMCEGGRGGWLLLGGLSLWLGLCRLIWFYCDPNEPARWARTERFLDRWFGWVFSDSERSLAGLVMVAGLCLGWLLRLVLAALVVSALGGPVVALVLRLLLWLFPEHKSPRLGLGLSLVHAYWHCWGGLGVTAALLVLLLGAAGFFGPRK